MIVCSLNGKTAYPSSSDKIKITYENQFVKDSGSYTYDISFPMDIARNREIFKNVQRLDVKKTVNDFDDCKLYADNRLLISGKGTVTSITNDTVKLQIVGGKSRIKYNSKFEKHFIDEINYPSVILDTGINKPVYDKAGTGYPNMDQFQWMLFIDLTTANFVGQKGVAVLSPVNDETNEILSNRVYLSEFSKIKINGVKYPPGKYAYMTNCSISPYLMYVLKKVMEYEGYTIKRNDLDRSPWNRLVIVSACKSGKIKNALPHWTVYKFIDELRKFFNASFVFDEISKTVSIIATDELLTNDTLTYDCEDDFSVEYDEDGLDNLSTSNIEYSFDDAANRDWREYISQSVQKNYTTKTYDTFADLMADAEKMTSKERKTTIFKCGHDYFVWADLPKDGNPGTEETTEQCTLCGLFNPVIRDMESDTFQELDICPAAVYQRKMQKQGEKWYEHAGDRIGNPFIVVPSVTNEKEQSLEDMEEDEDGEYYYSVQDAMQGSSSDTSSSSTADEGKMRVAFQAENLLNLEAHAAVAYDKRLDGEDTNYRVPVLYTDYRMYPLTLLNTETGTLSLEFLPNRNKGRHFGNLSGSGSSSSRFGDNRVDKHDLITIKFVTGDIPDPSKIFVFRNKRYICEKIEMNVTEDGIENEKTGYFYEIF
ncbi:hypothetical protein [uncultured Prevotella sp.]|uniref:hypothetical protein n=1 Tax=uncultured Prevotella sp. TaxID=159272 RepID=UPI0025982575|nr:hypothetical protein [uncultured Prevotella sp.]